MGSDIHGDGYHHVMMWAEQKLIWNDFKLYRATEQFLSDPNLIKDDVSLRCRNIGCDIVEPVDDLDERLSRALRSERAAREGTAVFTPVFAQFQFFLQDIRSSLGLIHDPILQKWARDQGVETRAFVEKQLVIFNKWRNAEHFESHAALFRDAGIAAFKVSAIHDRGVNAARLALVCSPSAAMSAVTGMNSVSRVSPIAAMHGVLGVSFVGARLCAGI